MKLIFIYFLFPLFFTGKSDTEDSCYLFFCAFTQKHSFVSPDAERGIQGNFLGLIQVTDIPEKIINEGCDCLI